MRGAYDWLAQQPKVDRARFALVGASVGCSVALQYAAKDRSVTAQYINGILGPTQEFVDEFIGTVGGPVALPHYTTNRFKVVKVPKAVKASPYIKKK